MPLRSCNYFWHWLAGIFFVLLILLKWHSSSAGLYRTSGSPSSQRANYVTTDSGSLEMSLNELYRCSGENNRRRRRRRNTKNEISDQSEKVIENSIKNTKEMDGSRSHSFGDKTGQKSRVDKGRNIKETENAIYQEEWPKDWPERGVEGNWEGRGEQMPKIKGPAGRGRRARGESVGAESGQFIRKKFDRIEKFRGHAEMQQGKGHLSEERGGGEFDPENIK